MQKCQPRDGLPFSATNLKTVKQILTISRTARHLKSLTCFRLNLGVVSLIVQFAGILLCILFANSVYV